MSYNATKHSVFTERCKNFANACQNLREEAAKMDAIYTNETASGSDPAWVDTVYATAAEHVDMILLFRDFKKFFENQSVDTLDRSQWITPFTSNA